MKQQRNIYAERLINTQKRHDRLRRAVALLSAIVMFLTMSSLKMSADTLERIPMCGIHEHVHTQACYSRGSTLPVCGMEEHVHTDACFQQRPLSGPAATRMDEFIPLSAEVNLTSDISVKEAEVADVAAAEIGEEGLPESDVEEEPAVDDYEGFELGENGMEIVPESVQTEIPEEESAETDADAPLAYVYSMEGQSSVQLSRVLSATGLELDIAAVDGAAQVLETEDAETVIAVESVEGDYTITPIASFDAAELAIFAGEDIHTVMLVNAVVDAGTETEEDNKEEEAAGDDAAEEDEKDETAIEGDDEEEETAIEGADEEEETAIEGTGETEGVEADVTAMVEDANVTIVAVGDNALPADSGIVYNENADRAAAIDELNSLLSAPTDRRMLKARNAMAAKAAVDEPQVQSDYAVFDISILADGEEYSETGEVEVTVRPDDVDMFANLPEGAQVVGVDYTLYHVHEGQVDTLPVQVDAEDGVIRTVAFNTTSFSNFILKYDVKYTVEFHQEDDRLDITLNFTGFNAVAANRDESTAVATLDDGLTLDLSRLFETAETEADGEILRGRYQGLTVDVPTDAYEAIDFAALDVVSAEGGVSYADGVLTIQDDGAVVLTDGTYTINLAVTGYADIIWQIRTLIGEGVTIEVLEGEVPETAEAVYAPHTDEETAELAQTYGIEGAGLSGFDVKIVEGESEFDAPGEYRVTVEPDIDPETLVPVGATIDNVNYVVYHIHDGEAVEVPASVEDGVLTFTTDSFSDFVVSYTVDFHWEVGGNTFELSLPGGGAIALSDLVQKLGIIEEESIPAFLADVEDVTFSSPELIWVGKVEEDTTVAELRDANGLDIDYSEELTAEQIDEINATVISAPDWALLSLCAFDTEESLTVTMNNGDQFVIRVTDARRPKLGDSYGRIKIVKEWYDANGQRIEAPTLDDTYTSDFILTAYEYVPSDLVRLHFVGPDGNDVNDPVIVPTGNLQLTLFNTPAGGGKGYVFSAKPTSLANPSNDINMLTDVNIQPKSVTLDSGETINTWVMNVDLRDYAGELYDVYLGIELGSDTTLSYFTNTTAPTWGGNASASTHAMNIAFLDSGRWQGDTYRNRHIWDKIKGQNNEYTLQNQDLELTSAGGKFFAYTIVENDASANGAKNFTTTISWNNGANVIYSNGLTGWSPNLYLNTPVLSNTDATVVTVKNQMRADVDVPVEKSWPYMDEYDNQYDWEAKFVLQWAPLYEGEGTPSTPFTEVEPRQYITITEAMMDAGNSEEAIAGRSFKKLPMYGEDENGPFRYEYSVEEESYTIYEHGNPSNVLATYDRYGEEGNKYTGGLPRFVPFYPHDAGELNANPSDYKVMVVNEEAYSTESPKINITINKDWEDDALMLDSNAKAAVRVQRYVQEIHRTKTSDYDATAKVEVKFFDKDGSYVKSQWVPKGVKQRLHIIWNSYGYGNSDFAISSTSPAVSFSQNGHSVSVLDSYTGWFTPTDGMEFHITVNKWGGDWQGLMPGVSPVAGVMLEDEQSRTEPVPDTAFNNSQSTFDLNLSNNWSEMVSGLPLVEYREDGDDLITYLYSYYFVEDPSGTDPAGYEPRYVRYDTVGTDHEVELGDNKYRINYDGEHVTVVNRKETLRVRKEWRGVAKNDWALYPDVKFDLYGSQTAGGDGINQNGGKVDQGTGYLTNCEKIGTFVLNADNDYEWTPEKQREEDNTFVLPYYPYYFVVERKDLIDDWDDNKYEVWMYYTDDPNTAQNGTKDQPWKKAVDSKGTLTIENAVKQYLQLDLKKKWMEWGTPTSWDTTTGVYKRLHDLVMGFVVYRRVWDVPIQGNSQYSNNNGHIISPGPMGWSDYGNEILVGYDSNGNRVLDPGGNTFELINGDGGNWHWTINNSQDHDSTETDRIGLPSQGWYTKPNGEKVWAYFEYTVRETGIWKNLKKDPVDDEEISWFTNSVPMASWYGASGQHNVDEFNRDIGQDQDRLMNGEAYNMYIEKQWDGSAWDAREVYVKIYRKSLDGQYYDDFTKELARDIKIGSLIGYVRGNESMVDLDNEWIVLTPSKPGLYIDKVLKAFPNTSGTNPYVYWMVEVGYKDKRGNVHTFDTTGHTVGGSGSNGNNPVVNQNAVTDNDLLKLTPTYYTWQDGHYVSDYRPGQNNPNVGIIPEKGADNKLAVKNTPVRDFAVVKKWENATGDDISNDPAVPNQLHIKIKQIRTARVNGEAVTKETYVKFSGSETLTITKANSDNSVVVVAQTHPGNVDVAQTYSAEVKNDTNVGTWGLYISGLEERYYDDAGVEWLCTYQVEEQTADIPNVFVTEVSHDGLIDRDNRNITITNVKMEGGMLKVVKQIAEGSDYETEDPFEITVTLTPPGTHGPEGEAFHLDPGKTIANYIEVDTEDTILLAGPTITGSNGEGEEITIKLTLAGRGFFTIKNIREGTTYEVSEVPGTGWQQQGIVYTNTNKTIVTKQLDTATITNEEVEISLSIEKVFDGELASELTDEQKKNVTFTVTGPGNFEETFTYGTNVEEGYVWHDGVHRDPSTWVNGVLTIYKIEPGTYTITEQHHDPASVFGSGVPSTYTHTWSYSVNGGTAITDPNPDQVNAEVIAGQNTQVLITNTYEELKQGALKLTKLVTVKGAAPNTKTFKEYVDGDYTFTIVGPEGAASPVTKYVRITVTDGVAASYKIADSNTDAAWEAAATVTEGTALVDGLDAGDYTVTEMPVEGMELSSITPGVAGTANTTNRTVTVRVTAGDTTAAQADASATYTNNKPLGDLEITKNIQTNSTLDTTKTGTFYYAVYSEEYDAAAEPPQTPVRTGSIEVTAGGTATVTEADLPYGTYYVYELTGENGTPIVSGQNGVNTAIGGKVYKVTGSGTIAPVGATKVTATLTNDEETVEVNVEKAWVNGNNNMPPAGAEITLTLYKNADDAASGSNALSFIVLNGIVDGTVTDGTFTRADGETTGSANAYEDSAWHAKWSNLPKYEEVSEVITEIPYVVTETGTQAGYKVSYDAEGNATYASNNGTVTNTEELKPFDFHKKWTDGVSDTARAWPTDAKGKKLPITVTLMGDLVYTDPEDSSSTSNIGTLNTDTNLDNYKFVLDPEATESTGNETPKVVPLKNGSADVTINIGGVDRTVTISLEASENDYTVTFSGLPKMGSGTGEWDYYVTEQQVNGYQKPQYPHEVGVERAYNGETITNARIVYELPSTGGTGTTLFYIGGASLMFLAVVAFVWQQKKRYQLIGD